MTIEVICAIISVSGIVFSAVISWLISRQTANKEIEKMRLAWKREDFVSQDSDFEEMIGAVSQYQTYYPDAESKKNALGKVGCVRAKTQGTLAEKTDRLYSAIARDSVLEISELLAEIINEKRKEKRK